MRIAVTATGFPSPDVVNRLAQAGHRVRCLYDPNAAFDESAHWDRNIEWLLGSAYDPVSIAALVQDADAVFHVPSSLDRGDLEDSVIVPMRALLAAYDAGVSRFVYAVGPHPLTRKSYLDLELIRLNENRLRAKLVEQH